MKDRIEEIMSLVSTEDIGRLAEEYKVDKHNTKLLGKLMFKGLMRLILSGKKVSLRMLSLVMNQGIMDKNSGKKVTFSGISKRLNTLKVEYFRAIYEDLVKKCETECNQDTCKSLYRFDSTIINLSGYIMKDGLKIGGKKQDSQIKVSIGLRNQLPSSIRFCSEQQESSENIALIRAINDAKIEKEDILLFDRGISKAASFEELSKKDYKFITRVNVGRNYNEVGRNKVLKAKEGEQEILEDLIVHLYGRKKKCVEKSVRLIKIKNKEGNEIWFLSNLFEMPAYEVTELYRRRWDIEVFFKFIKQNLGYKHFLSHSINGMKVYIYMILITALMFLIYKIRNKLKGFKLALFEFTLELERSFIINLIQISGGDLKAVEHLL